MKKVLVCGGGGFIGGHLVTSLKQLGYYVIGADIKSHEYQSTDADEFYKIDLRDSNDVTNLLTGDIDTVYQLAADMGGAGYVFTGKHDAEILSNSLQINLNIANAIKKTGVKNIFFTSSACVYPMGNQENLSGLTLEESTAYPANPDSEYGWEKLTSERLFLSHARNSDLRVRIARLHNIFGPLGAWNNGKEKAPAALCRKIASTDTGSIEIWGNGQQMRSFLYIDECIKGIHKIHNSNCTVPVNLGSTRMISINQLAGIIANIANKKIVIKHIDGPLGVSYRTSDNTLIKRMINWEPEDSLEQGLSITYNWIKQQIKGAS